MHTLIENGELYGPKRPGRQCILLADSRIAAIGRVDRRALETLGVDTTMKTMPGLLARAKALEEEGLNAFIWTGGYGMPAATLLASGAPSATASSFCVRASWPRASAR